jgi:hypothetical protein
VSGGVRGACAARPARLEAPIRKNHRQRWVPPAWRRLRAWRSIVLRIVAIVPTTAIDEAGPIPLATDSPILLAKPDRSPRGGQNLAERGIIDGRVKNR